MNAWERTHQATLVRNIDTLRVCCKCFLKHFYKYSSLYLHGIHARSVWKQIISSGFFYSTSNVFCTYAHTSFCWIMWRLQFLTMIWTSLSIQYVKISMLRVQLDPPGQCSFSSHVLLPGGQLLPSPTPCTQKSVHGFFVQIMLPSLLEGNI